MDEKRRLLRVDHLPMMALQLTESNTLEIQTPRVEFDPHARDDVDAELGPSQANLNKDEIARKKQVGKMELEACLVGTEFHGRFPDQGALLGDVYDDIPDESDEVVYDALEKAYNAAFSNSTMDRVERDRKFHEGVTAVQVHHRPHPFHKRQSTAESFDAWKERLLEGRKEAFFAVLKTKALDDLNDYREYFIQQHQRKLIAMRNRKLEQGVNASDIWRDHIIAGKCAVHAAATTMDERRSRRKAQLRDIATRCRDLQLKRQTRLKSKGAFGDKTTPSSSTPSAAAVASISKDGDAKAVASPQTKPDTSSGNPIMISRPRDILADNAKLIQYLMEEADTFVELLLGNRLPVVAHGRTRAVANLSEIVGLAETNSSKLYQDHVDALAEFDADWNLRHRRKPQRKWRGLSLQIGASLSSPVAIDVSNPFHDTSSGWSWLEHDPATTTDDAPDHSAVVQAILDGPAVSDDVHRRMTGLYKQGVNAVLVPTASSPMLAYPQVAAFLADLALVGGKWGPHLIVSDHVHEWEAAIASLCPSLRVLPYWGSSDDRRTLRQFWSPSPNRQDDAVAFHVVLTNYRSLFEDVVHFQQHMLWQVVTYDAPFAAAATLDGGYAQWAGLALSLRCRQRWLVLESDAKIDLRLLLHFVAPALFDSKQKTMAWGSAALDDVAVQSLRSIVQRVCVGFQGTAAALDQATHHTLDLSADERAVLVALDATPVMEYVLANPDSSVGPSEMDLLEKYKRQNHRAKIVVDTKRLMLRTPTTPMFENPSSIALSLPKPAVVDPKLIACKHCAKTFMTSSGLLKHTKSDHAPAGTWTCRKCGVDCGTMALRNAHERQEHDESITPSNKPSELTSAPSSVTSNLAPSHPNHTSGSASVPGNLAIPSSAASSAQPKPSRRSTGGGGSKKRVTRCGKCPGCLSGDCMECGHCQDMKKYGGPGLRKQSCKNRKCTNPQVLGSVGGDDDDSKPADEFLEESSNSSGGDSSESEVDDDPTARNGAGTAPDSDDDGDSNESDDGGDDDNAPIKASKGRKSKGSSASSRTRVMRCGVCVGCLAGDCLKCRHCQDMKKYGGPGLRKQSCKSRKCVTPKVVLLNQGQEDDGSDMLIYDDQHTPRSSGTPSSFPSSGPSSAATTATTPACSAGKVTLTTPAWEKEALADAGSVLAPSIYVQSQLNRFLKITCLRCNAKFLNQSLKSLHDVVVHQRSAAAHLWQRAFVRDRLATIQFQYTLVATDPRRKKPLDFEPVGYAKLVGPGLSFYMLRPNVVLGRVASEWKDRYRTMGLDLHRGFSGGDVDCHLGDDLMISAQHAKIRWDVRRQRYVIECLSVLTPLSVNGHEVAFGMAPLPLTSQSLVQVGAFYFYFLLPVASTVNLRPTTTGMGLAQTSRHRQGLPRQEVYAWLAHKRAALRLQRRQQDGEPSTTHSTPVKRKIHDGVDGTPTKRQKPTTLAAEAHDQDDTRTSA